MIATTAALYALATAIALGTTTAMHLRLPVPPEWLPLPVVLMAIVSSTMTALAWRRAGATGAARTIWAWVAAFGLCALVAECVWNLWRPRDGGPVFSRADALYVLSYSVLACAYANAYRGLGGRFTAPRVRLEAIAMFAALLVTLWSVTRGPLAPVTEADQLPWAYAAAYSITIAMLATLAAMLAMSLGAPRRQGWLVLLLAAGLVAGTWEIGWLGSWMSTSEFLGPFFSFGDVLCFALLCAAARLAPRPQEAFAETAVGEQHIYNFLPALTVLVAIALIVGLLAAAPDRNDWSLAGTTLILAGLLLGRQRHARTELAHLNAELAVRRGDARVTELVRQAADLFAIVADDGCLAFASPAAPHYTGREPAALVGSRAESLLGDRHAPGIARLLEQARQSDAGPVSVELATGGADGAMRVLRLVASNQRSNEHIRGLTLTISDISAERGLERELLEVSNNERIGLAADLHEGLGQSLTGIALLLQAELNERGSSGAGRGGNPRLESVTGMVRQAITAVRELARGAAPLYTVGGSLSNALLHIGPLVPGEPPIRMDIAPDIDDRVIDKATSEHLFRIALEALRNARRYSQCRLLELSLHRGPDQLTLGITDDGTGFDPAQSGTRGLALRLISYRARMIGATLVLPGEPGGGMHIEIRLPLRA